MSSRKRNPVAKPRRKPCPKKPAPNAQLEAALDARVLELRHQNLESVRVLKAHSPGKPEDLLPVTAEMINHFAYRSLRRALKEGRLPEPLNLIRMSLACRDRDLRAARLALDRARFEFSASRAVLKHLEKLKRVKKAPHLDEEQKIIQVRKILFGEAP